jgi:hypothetical protein
MALQKISESDKQLARKVGKLPKAPRKPRQSASVTVMENYIARHNHYVKKIKDMAARARKKEALKKQIHGL